LGQVIGRELSLGEVVSKTFDHYRQNFVRCFILFVVVELIIGVLNTLRWSNSRFYVHPRGGFSGGGFLYLMAFSLGLGIPFLIAGAFISRVSGFMRRSGQGHMRPQGQAARKIAQFSLHPTSENDRGFMAQSARKNIFAFSLASAVPPDVRIPGRNLGTTIQAEVTGLTVARSVPLLVQQGPIAMATLFAKTRPRNPG
jgi:hypothetical protein